MERNGVRLPLLHKEGASRGIPKPPPGGIVGPSL
jgi:hypothetical protein